MSQQENYREIHETVVKLSVRFFGEYWRDPRPGYAPVFLRGPL